MLHKAVAILPAINIRNTIEFYECKLGFTGTSFGNYGILKNHQVEIHIRLVDSKRIIENAACYIFVDNIEDLYTDYSAKELISPNGQLVNSSRGYKEFTIFDNNGNLLRFGQKR
jgi:hypothetical protein